jgi:hypothetical protein
MGGGVGLTAAGERKKRIIPKLGSLGTISASLRNDDFKRSLPFLPTDWPPRSFKNILKKMKKTLVRGEFLL